MILVEAAFFGDAKAAHHYGITTRTIRNYRNLLENNEEISAIFLQKQQEFELNWVSRIPKAIIAGIEFINRAAQTADPANPYAISAMADAIKALAEIGLTKEILDAKIGRFIVADGTENR